MLRNLPSLLGELTSVSSSRARVQALSFFLLDVEKKQF